MTVERRTELQDRLRKVLGEQPAATLWGMLPGRDDLATRTDLTELQNALRGEIVGVREQLKGEIAGVREDLTGETAGLRQEVKGEIAELRTDVATFRAEMTHRYATKDDLFALAKGFNDAMRGYVRTFIAVQAATVVGMSGILFGLLRFF